MTSSVLTESPERYSHLLNTKTESCEDINRKKGKMLIVSYPECNLGGFDVILFICIFQYFSI